MYTQNTRVRYCKRDEDDQMIKGHIKKMHFQSMDLQNPNTTKVHLKALSGHTIWDMNCVFWSPNI